MPSESEPAATYEPIASLKPWKKNPRKNDGEPVDRVAESIRRFGFSSPIIARLENRQIIAGHTRWKAAKKLGLAEVPVRFLDIDEAQAEALALADNRLSEITPWDDDGLAEVMRSLDAADVDLSGLGWSSEELDALIKGAAPAEQEDGQEQTVPEKWEVLVFVSGEDEQAKAIEWIEQGGFKCQPLIS